MNSYKAIGRLTAKPELRYTNSNIPVTRFNIAINGMKREDGTQETDFIPITVWRKQAENVCNYLDKGSLVAVEGKLKSGSYDDKDGNKKYTLDVIAERVQFLESKRNDSQQQTNVSPYDYQTKDAYADFGDCVSIDDNFLD